MRVGTQLDADGIICRFQLRVDQGAEMHAICWDVDDMPLCLGLDRVGPFDVGRLFSSRVEFAHEAFVAHVCRRILTKL
jgi:hypothetical protein